MNTTAKFHVAVVNGLDRVQVTETMVSIDVATRLVRKLGKQGRTAWVEDSEGNFQPVKGCMRDWSNRPRKR